MPFELDKVYQYDARKILDIIPEKVIDVTITSPPYYNMKDYGYEGQIGFGQSYEQYLEDLFVVFKGVFQCTKDDGSLWVIIDTLRHEGEMKLIPFDFVNRIAPIGWKLKEIIIWKKDKTVPWTHAGQMRNAFEYILMFSKKDRFRFNVESIKETEELKRWWVKYPERYHPKGRTPEDVWEFPIPVQGSWGNNYIRHFCPLPEGLIERILKITTVEGDVVFDPFAGSGAVLSKADFMRRRYVGTEMSSSYIEMFREYDATHRDVALARYDSAKEVIHSSSFEELIWKLRVLKYARVLYKKIENNGVDYIYAAIDEVKGIGSDQYLRAFYIIIVRPNIEHELVENVVSRAINCSPLSKYGIKPDITISDRLNVGDTSLFTYSKSNSHKYLRSIDISFLPFLKRREVVVSPIGVNLNEQDYE